jgi:hypothetical protein
MRTAKSMYLGGEIISAENCTYDSYEKLGLQCPFCNSAVFFSSESSRSVRGKEQNISSYFSHFHSDNRGNHDCENRAKTSQGKAELERMRAESKNQRLKIYNLKLWQIIADYQDVEQQDLNEVRSLLGRRWCEQTTRDIQEKWSDPQYLAIECDYILEYVNTRVDYHRNNLEQKFDFMVTIEVIDFLSTRSASFVFPKIFQTSIFCMELADIKIDRDTRVFSIKRWNQMMRQMSGYHKVKSNNLSGHIQLMMWLIATFPWREQIKKFVNAEDHPVLSE